MIEQAPTTEQEKRVFDLEAEIAEKKKELRKLRAEIPPTEVSDYTFEDNLGEEVKLSELFGDKNELILISNMGKSCAYCTLWADNFNGIVKPLNDRAAFAVVSPDSPQVQKEFAASRDWKFLMASHLNNNWAIDFGFQGEDHILPGVASFTKDESGKIFFHSKAFFGPGDNYCSMWDFIDLLPKGVDGWMPKYDY
ncbi:MAG: DUF899 family protein [Flavobacteriales bacterium]|nr:DUF899 family protein [Flavobacteriales bacterium]